MHLQEEERFTYQDRNRILQDNGFQGQPLQEDMITTFSSPNSNDLHYTNQVDSLTLSETSNVDFNLFPEFIFSNPRGTS